MQPLLQNKIVLITGGGSGVGKAAALLFADEGATVVVANRRQEQGRACVLQIIDKGGEAVFVQTDVAKKDQVDQLVKTILNKYGRLDGAFNCAGMDGNRALFDECNEHEWDQIMQINVKGTFYLMQQEIKAMLPQKSGTVVNMASVSGMLGRPQRSAYNASRAAIISMTKTAAIENIKRGIRINCVAPAAINTDIFKRMTGNDPAKAEAYAKGHPIGRIAEPEEIAEAALWLCSDRSSFVVGHALVVDGGVMLL